MNKIILGAVLCRFSLTTAYAEEGKEKKWEERVKKELNLTDEQVKKISSIKDKYKSQLQSISEEKKKTRKELMSMTKEPDTSKSFNDKLTVKHKELQAIESRLEDKRFSMLLETRSLLKPDQVSKMDKLFMKKRHKRRHHKKEKRQAQEEIYLEEVK